MKLYIRGFILGAIISGLLPPVYPAVRHAGAADVTMPSKAVVCSGSAYTVYPDIEGVNIRLAPHKTAAILRVIPYDRERTLVGLSAAYEDWVLVHSAEGPSSDFRFEEKGWVYAPLLAVRAEHRTGRKIPLYREPDSRSHILRKLESETEVRLKGCKDAWRQVNAGKQTGWLAPDEYCGNPVTTCP